MLGRRPEPRFPHASARRGCLLLACLLGAGCATTGAGRAARSAEAIDAYHAEVRPRAVRGPAAVPVTAALRAALREMALPVVGDGRLAALAHLLAPQADAEERELRAAELGVVDGQLEVIALSREGDASWADAIDHTLRPRLIDARPTHFGAYTFDRRYAHVVIGRRPTTLERVARQQAPGSTLVLRGRLPAIAREPVVEVVGPDGAYRTMSAGAGPEFEVRVPARDEGAYRVRLVASDGTGPAAARGVWARLRVQVGSADDEESGVRALPPVRRYYEQIARMRSRRGLRPLAVAGRLERAAQAGERPSGALVFQAAVRGRDADALGAALRADPAARAAIDHAEVTHVGACVVTGSRGLELRLLSAAIEPGAANERSAARVLSAINRARRQRGAPPLEPDRRFGEVARATLEAHLRGTLASEQEMVDFANGELERFSIAQRRVAAVVAFVSDPSEAYALEPALDAEARVVGVGVGRREVSSLDGRDVAVVLVLGWPR